MPYVNAYKFISECITTDSCHFVNMFNTSLRLFRDGKLPENLHDDLAEIILEKVVEDFHHGTYDLDIKYHFINNYKGKQDLGAIKCGKSCENSLEKGHQICPFLIKKFSKNISSIEVDCPRLAELIKRGKFPL
jgi:hypothetical protein